VPEEFEIRFVAISMSVDSAWGLALPGWATDVDSTGGHRAVVQFTSLTPMLQTADLGKTIAFYRDILCFELIGLWPDEASPVWCELACGMARLMFMTNDHLREPQLSGTLYIRTSDVLALHARIVDKVVVERGARDLRLWDARVRHQGLQRLPAQLRPARRAGRREAGD
jgi:hypothetical protein